MHILETKTLLAELHPRGAALHRLIYKPFHRNLVRLCADRNAPNHYCNTVVGPIANRIAGARFAIDGEEFILDANNGMNTLHGGRMGLSELDWQVAAADNNAVHFTLALPDLHMGFPGPARFDALYRVEGESLWVEYRATSPRRNFFNLAPHFFFNLDGENDFESHALRITAAQYLPVDDAMIPTGQAAPVAGTPLDFRKARPLKGAVLDNNFCLDGFAQGGGMREAARLTAGGIALSLATDCPGLQIYDARRIGRSHIALEPQGWPNAVNEPSFPQGITPANAIYRAVSCFAFSET